MQFPNTYVKFKCRWCTSAFFSGHCSKQTAPRLSDGGSRGAGEKEAWGSYLRVPKECLRCGVDEALALNDAGKLNSDRGVERAGGIERIGHNVLWISPVSSPLFLSKSDEIPGTTAPTAFTFLEIPIGRIAIYHRAVPAAFGR